jgi:outer membrane receptor for monomeric catechols
MRSGLFRTAAMSALTVSFAHDAGAADRGEVRSKAVVIRGSAISSAGALKAQSAPGPAARWKQPTARTLRTLAPDRSPYADAVAPYKADRLGWSPAAQPIINLPGQTTVLTRQILDDKNATTLRDALRTTAGVTVGR